MNEKDAFLSAWDRETATTIKVLRAYPTGKESLKPHDTCRNAKELAWTFAFEGAAATQAVQGEFSFPPKNMPAMPDSWNGIVTEVERTFKRMSDAVRQSDDRSLNSTIKFYTAPKQMGDVRRQDFLWLMLNDMIHHRGQFSVYLRMAGGKVPSIYGPSKDEPWQ
jgi:uncharacterized damage-inducible protein DinB